MCILGASVIAIFSTQCTIFFFSVVCYVFPLIPYKYSNCPVITNQCWHTTLHICLVITVHVCMYACLSFCKSLGRNIDRGKNHSWKYANEMTLIRSKPVEAMLEFILSNYTVSLLQARSCRSKVTYDAWSSIWIALVVDHFGNALVSVRK